MLHSFTPRSSFDSFSHHNLATGTFAEASLRAWNVLRFAREYHQAGDPARMAEILSVIKTSVGQWPVEVQRFLFRGLAAIGGSAAQANEVA
jgi:hypothetical protein